MEIVRERKYNIFRESWAEEANKLEKSNSIKPLRDNPPSSSVIKEGFILKHNSSDVRKKFRRRYLKLVMDEERKQLLFNYYKDQNSKDENDNLRESSFILNKQVR